MTITILNMKSGERVQQRLIIVYGSVSSNSDHLSLLLPNSSYSSQKIIVSNSLFKALVPLETGWNTLIFVDANSESTFLIEYLPNFKAPPLHLAILIGADSEETFDVPAHKEDQNTLEIAIARLRMQGYLWQAFTAEQMYRHGFERRTFRFEEDFQPDTITIKKELRQTARVTLIRSSLTVAELREWNSPTTKRPDYFDIWLKELTAHGAPFDSPCYVAGMFLDSHYDSALGDTRCHCALGGGAGNIRLGIFGSHTVHAWPGNLEELAGCLLDMTPNDPSRTANDNGECGTSYKAWCVGSGAFLHEVGHSLTLTHTPSGIMSRGFNHFNRSFMVIEYSDNGTLSGITPEMEDGAHWHRADALRLRFHPCLALPGDVVAPKGGDPVMSRVAEGLFVNASAVINMLEWSVGDGLVRVDELWGTRCASRVIELNPEILRKIRGGRSGDIRLTITCVNQTNGDIDNVEQFLADSYIPGLGFKSALVGQRRSGGPRKKFQINFSSNGGLKYIKFFADVYLHGMQCIFNNGSTLNINHTDRGNIYSVEMGSTPLVQLAIKAGWWIDGCELIFKNGLRSGWIGGGGNRTPAILEERSGHDIVGIYGEHGDFIDGIGIIYK
ncbi:hypothetical protein HK096_004142 [Nowakowskiella sp. JEL0078]|nr:hypothetical protein HK096_004142 [Nowakowskiella sp. JEL0078]